jgi:hypothetical protein
MALEGASAEIVEEESPCVIVDDMEILTSNRDLLT